MTTSIIFDAVSGKFIGSLGGKVVSRATDRAYVARRLKVMSGNDGAVVDKALVPAVPEPVEKYSINTRFNFVEKLVTMVAHGIQASAIITGQGGLGKTYTVLKALKAMGLKEVPHTAIPSSNGEDEEPIEPVDMNQCYVFIKGFSTAKGLYRTLYENNHAVVIFDDCDSVLKDPVALNILKSALDSYSLRTISWNADMKDPDLPRSFDFDGRVIFISNLCQHKVDQAIRSRSMMIDLSMTQEQKIDRMEFIAAKQDFLPEYTLAIKKDALNLIRKLHNEIKDVNLRTLISICRIRASNTEWEDMATYMLTI